MCMGDPENPTGSTFRGMGLLKGRGFAAGVGVVSQGSFRAGLTESTSKGVARTVGQHCAPGKEVVVMKPLRTLLFLVFSSVLSTIGLVSAPRYCAAFIDNFEDNDISDWTVKCGGWEFAPG